MLILLLTATLALAGTTVAVVDFESHSVDERLRPLGAGVADMLITDLQRSAELQLVERSRLDAIERELTLQQSAYADAATAVQLGKGVGADAIVTGALTIAMEGMRIDARLVDVQTGEIRAAVQAVGPEDSFFDLERQIATRLLAELGTVAEVPQRNLTLEQALLAARRLEEAESEYVDRLQLLQAYKGQRWVRETRPPALFWGVYDGSGTLVPVMDVGAVDGDAKRLAVATRRQKAGSRTLLGSAILGGGLLAVGVPLLVAAPKYNPNCFSVDCERRNDRSSTMTTAGAAASALSLVSVGWGVALMIPQDQAARRHDRVWSAEQADAVVRKNNDRLADELGLTPSDRAQADLQD